MKDSVQVTPAITKLDLAVDAPETYVSYKNNTNFPVEVSLSASNFSSLEDGWKINFLEPKDAQNYKYSLTSWIHFEKENLNLDPGKEEKVKVFIDKDKLPFGGHYAAILAKISATAQNKGQIVIEPTLSSLLFVRAASGHEQISGELNDFKVNGNFFVFPENALVRFKNTGNSETVPHGQIDILDFRNSLVARGIVNEDSLFSLPESIRRYDSKIKQFQSIELPGIYTAHLSMHLDSNQTLVLQKDIKFLSFGNKNMLEIEGFFIAILIIIFFVIRAKKPKK